MLIIKAPMRISFAGGGTDMPAFYRLYSGQVISTTIDKYVYVAINRPPLIRQVSARYSIAEMVDHPSQLKNNRIREALLDLEILNNIEIATFTDIPINTGLGSSSSFSTALIKGLYLCKGQKINRLETAEAACRLEIDLVGEPIGKQDQYAATFGGFNIFKFNTDHSVEIEPLYLDFKKRLDLENHILIFFTGITRLATDVLAEQKEKMSLNIETLKQMAEAVPIFKNKLIAGDFEALGRMLHQAWQQKKTLTDKISNPTIDLLYQTGLDGGAWGGKILGAGGGGCLLFLVPVDKKQDVRQAVNQIAQKNNLANFIEVPVHFTQSGVEVLVNSN